MSKSVRLSSSARRRGERRRTVRKSAGQEIAGGSRELALDRHRSHARLSPAQRACPEGSCARESSALLENLIDLRVETTHCLPPAARSANRLLRVIDQLRHDQLDLGHQRHRLLRARLLPKPGACRCARAPCPATIDARAGDRPSLIRTAPESPAARNSDELPRLGGVLGPSKEHETGAAGVERPLSVRRGGKGPSPSRPGARQAGGGRTPRCSTAQ